MFICTILLKLHKSANVIKSFQVFGEDQNNNAFRSDKAKPRDDEEGNEEKEFVDVSAILNDSYLLNLIAMVDSMKATSEQQTSAHVRASHR